MTQGKFGMSNAPLAEQIANRLRRDILRGTLAPGAPVKERDNAADLGVSRTPMREAIRILAKEGLVILRPSRSPLVANPALKEVQDAITVLIALESLSARLACQNASDADIAEIRAIHRHMSEIYDAADPLDLFEVDMSFHLSIARASKNAALAETHRSYLARLWRARYLSASQRRNRERVISQHGAILAGIEARDEDRVTAAIGVHLDRLAEHIAQIFEESEADGIATDSPSEALSGGAA